MPRIAVLLASLLISGAANAASVTWTFTGIVRDIPSATPLPPELASLGVGIGTQVSGSLQFDTDAPNTDPPGNVANYSPAIERTSVTVGSWMLSCDLGSCPTGKVANSIIVFNNSDANRGQLSGIDVNESSGALGLTTLVLELTKTSPGPTLWPGNAMLVTPPPLSALDPYGFDPNKPLGYGSDIYILADVGGNPAPLELRAELTSLVPEPVAPMLFALSLAALSARRALR